MHTSTTSKASRAYMMAHHTTRAVVRWHASLLRTPHTSADTRSLSSSLTGNDDVARVQDGAC